MQRIIKTFTFIDESGTLIPKPEPSSYYGVGAFKHTKSIEFVNRIHKVYEGLCAALKKDETRVEFSFKSTTASSIKYDLQLLDALDGDYDWEFNCVYFDCKHPHYIQPSSAIERWEKYVTFTKLVIERNLWRDEETVVLADYQRKPKQSRKKFEFVATDIPQVHNILQTESHGVLPIQVADLLLGGFLYSLDKNKGDKEGNKTKIVQKINALKKKVGKKKFNCFEVDWSKSSRMGRV